MAKRITKRPAKKPAAKRATTKKPNTNNKRVTTKAPTGPKPTRKQVSQAVKKINQRGQAKLNALKNANAASKAKKVSRFGLPGKIAAIGTLLGGTAFMTKKKKDPSFGEAFKKARKEKGPMSTFTYKGKKYSTVTKDQVEKAGYSTLRQYLNAGGKKKKTGLTTKRRKTGGPPSRRRR